jgi:hypothetical protein
MWGALSEERTGLQFTSAAQSTSTSGPVLAALEVPSANLSWCQAPIWASWPIFLLLLLFLKLCLDSSGFADVVHLLWREIRCVVCSCSQASSAQSWPYFTFSIETPPAWRGSSCIYIPQEQSGPGLGFVPILTPYHTTDSQIARLFRPLSGPVANFYFPLTFFLDSCTFVILWLPLWREDGSVIFCCCWASPAKWSWLWHLGAYRAENISSIIATFSAYNGSMPVYRYLAISVV